MGLMGYSGALGKQIREKPEVENLATLSLFFLGGGVGDCGAVYKYSRLC